MKKNILLASVWLLLLCLSLPVFATSTPAADDGKWYCVKSQRFAAGTGPWWTFGTKIIPGSLTKADNQQFTLVTTVAGKVTIQEKTTSSFLTATSGLFSVTKPAAGWTITPNPVNGVVGTAFPGENLGLHQGSDGWNWEVRADGWYDLTDFCTFFFYEVKADIDLNIAIDAAKTLKSTATIGTNPGQTPQVAHDAYQTAINTATTTLGSTDATAIQNAVNALAVATTTFNNAKIVPFITATPVADDGKWYYVKSQRNAGAGPFLTYGTKMIPSALTKADNQKFTLVTTVAGKVTIKEKVTSSLLTAAGGVFSPTGAATGWTLTQNNVNGIIGYTFPGEDAGLHQGSSGWNWEVRSSYYSISDNCTFFFYEAKEDAELVMAVESAFIRISNASAGTTLGKTPQSAIDAYRGTIESVKTTIGSTDPTAIQTAISTLASATSTFVQAKIQPVDKSTAASPIWYLIKNTIRTGKGATLYTNGLNAQLKCTTAANTVAANGTSTGDAAPALKYLFRFDQQSNGDFQIVNAALPSGELLQTATGGNSSQAIKYGTVASPVTTWKVNFIGTNASLAVDELTFVSTGVATMFHDDSTNGLVSYTGGTGGASAWYVEKYTGDVNPLYQTQFDALKAEYDAIADGTGAPVAPYTIGTESGQYGQVKFDELKTAYAAMVTEKNTNGVNSVNMIQKFTELSVAISAFKASKVLPSVAYAGAIDVSKTYTLKLVQPGSANDGYYLANPRLDTDNGIETTRPNATFGSAIALTTAWKFTASATPGKYIITSARKTNEYIDEVGRVRDASSWGDNDWVYKTLLQNTTTYVDGTTLLIVKIDKNGNFLRSGTAAAATLANSAEWSTFKLELYSGPTNKVDAKTELGKAYAINGVIIVTNTTDFNVFTISGSKVKNENLKPGVYFVKSSTDTFKVFVK